MKQLEIFRSHINFAMAILINVYPYEYMDSWEKFNKTSIPPKEAYHSELKEEDIRDADYEHAQKVWEVFKVKDIGENHDLYVQSDTLLLADVFENFRDKCIEIYVLDPAHFYSTRISMASLLKKDRSIIRINNRY